VILITELDDGAEAQELKLVNQGDSPVLILEGEELEETHDGSSRVNYVRYSRRRERRIY